MRGLRITKEKLIDRMLDGLFPLRCPICGQIPKEGKVLACSSCKKGLTYIEAPICLMCGVPVKREYTLCTNCINQTHIFERNLSVWEYSTPMKRSLYAFKYNSKCEYAKFYGEEAVKRYGVLFKMWGVQVVIPVPLHKTRQRIRGYNQSACFGREVAKGLSLPFCKDVLIRRKETNAQKTLSLGERSRNLCRAFCTKEGNIPYQRVLLVDDIYTTGSTLDQCALALKSAGVEVVFTLTIARALD